MESTENLFCFVFYIFPKILGNFLLFVKYEGRFGWVLTELTEPKPH